MSASSRWMAVVLGAVLLVAPMAGAQARSADPVFRVELVSDRQPLVAGEQARLATVVSVQSGWHVNSDQPGDEFSMPTIVSWLLPDGWPQPDVSFPEATPLTFPFADQPIAVWQGQTVVVGRLLVPDDARGPTDLAVEVTAQACDGTRCLPPVLQRASLRVDVAAPGTKTVPVHTDLFGPAAPSGGAGAAAGDPPSPLADLSLPLLLATVFLAGLALNLTPCVYPLIPITVGFFAQQSKRGTGGSFALALVYVLGMSVTYSVLGVTAALTGSLFGTALSSPVVVGVIVVVLLALAASMFGLWELRVPGWAMRASGGRSGAGGALLMGLLVGFVAAPCIGPFVLGLLTFVGQRGDPVLGFSLFFTLAMGLGVPYLVLGTFTGAVNRLPASGQWMVGVRKVFGVLLVAMAVYFARTFMPPTVGALAMGAVLVAGGLYLLVVDRTGHEQALVDRFMRLVSIGLVVAGVLLLPRSSADDAQELAWHGYDRGAVTAAISSGQPVILDFYADWCAPCRELDEKTFSDPRVAGVLADYARFKVDQTHSVPENVEAAEDFEVMGMPTVIVFRDGKERFRITGFEAPERFLERLK